MEADPVIRQLVEAVAREHGLTISYDTYYDAGNWQLSWWEGGVRQAIDVQEYPDGWIEVSRQSTLPHATKAAGMGASYGTHVSALGARGARGIGETSLAGIG
ncbi:hypothetical protein MUU77_00910 [Pseudoxanthomonas sp. F37]|uniref:hypothetical protein n=1 Tax=Pseudoxanthomonas TaxID=83618 RepID=UPI001FD2384C|nr:MULTISPECIES: hypothetical protein [Pseudoxanthomonas]UOV03913.1 hypothetical protein MUU75_12145 [Pseudoxanthomonas mexicana]UOV08912.1 hypothetical protein MUU77_00910 [Pseudoxanthomonas sp. F37]